MSTTLDVVLLLMAYPLDSAGAEQLVVLSTHPWASEETDTPAHQPAVALIKAGSLVEEARWWRQQDDGLLLLGGVGAAQAVNVVVENPRDEADHTTPLDDVEDLDWSGARVEVWSAQVVPDSSGAPSARIPFASFSQRAELRVDSLSYGSPDATLTLTWPDAFDAPTTPVKVRGWGWAARSTIRLADVSSTRGTGSQTALWILDNGTISATSQTLHDGQVWRLRATTSNVEAGVRNAAGTWQNFTTRTAVAGVYTQLALTYDSATNKARLYQDGAFAQELTITGGLWASSVSQDLVWLTSSWHCGGWAHYSANKSDAWVAQMYHSGVVDDPDLNVGFAFDEAAGKAAFSVADSYQATVESGVWAETKWGDSGLAGERLQAVLGIAFGVEPTMYSADAARYVTGYTADRPAQRHVSEDGHRLKPGSPDTGSTSRTVNAARDTISNVPVPTGDLIRWEFAKGQGLTRSPAGGAGNPTALTIDRVLVDPRVGDAQSAGAIRTVEDQTADETASFGLTETSHDYVDGSLYNGSPGTTNLIFPGFIASVALEGDLRVSMARATGDDSESLLTHLADHFGAAPGIAITHERSTSKIWRYGWVTDGAAPWRDAADPVALSSLSVDDGPMFVGLEPDGDLEAYGLRFSGSDDFFVDPAMIRDITRERLAARPGVVVVRYARCWAPVPPSESLVTGDLLPAAMRAEWLTVEDGSGSRRGYFESAAMLGRDARRQAAALLRIQGGDVYRVELYAPVPDSMIRDARPGRLTTIEWDERPEWAAGVQGVVVGYRRGVSTLTLWIWAEV